MEETSRKLLVCLVLRVFLAYEIRCVNLAHDKADDGSYSSQMSRPNMGYRAIGLTKCLLAKHNCLATAGLYLKLNKMNFS